MRNDWASQVKVDLDEFGISLDLDDIKSKSTFKKMEKIKDLEFELFRLLKMILTHTTPQHTTPHQIRATANWSSNNI